MDSSSNTARVKADLYFLLRARIAFDVERACKTDSSIGEWWLLSVSGGGAWYGLPSGFRHVTHLYSNFLTSCLSCTIQNLALSSVRVDFTHHAWLVYGYLGDQRCDVVAFVQQNRVLHWSWYFCLGQASCAPYYPLVIGEDAKLLSHKFQTWDSCLRSFVFP